MALVRSGAQVVFCATNICLLHAAIEECGAASGRAVAYGVDLSHCGEAECLVESARRWFGGVDVLVNNAGQGPESIRRDYVAFPLRFWEVSDADMRRMFDVNLFAACALARLVAPEMISRNWGRIVNVTTRLSSMLLPGIFPYGGTKATLEATTAAMAGDLAGTGVTANVLCPGGPSDTAMVPSSMLREKLSPSDCLAAPIVWLASNSSDGITGRRFVGNLWDRTKADAEAAGLAGDAIAWTGKV